MPSRRPPHRPRRRPLRRSGRRAPRLAAGLAALVVLLAGSGCGVFGGDGPDAAVGAFLAAWSAGDDRGAAALTDDPATAADLLVATRQALGAKRLTAELKQVRTATDRAAASVLLTWDLGSGRQWTYLGEVEVAQAIRGGSSDPTWTVHWAPTVVHPQLAAGQRLALRTEDAQPAPVVDRGGVPLMSPTTVVSVLLDRLATGDLPAAAGTLAAALAPIDPQITQASIIDGAAATPDGQAYTVAALRDADYQGVKGAIHDLPGVRFASSQRLLAPNAGFARAVLPAVRTGMAPQLDGVAGWSVLVVDTSGGAITTLAGEPPKPGTTVTVGLDRAVQSAAEDAVEPLAQQTMIVAVAPSTGDLLAVAQNGAADAVGAPALAGRYPPGSTFKIATATAAVAEQGLRSDSPVDCPGVTVIGGRPVPNAERFDLGTVPLITAFARSCNTTFAQLGSRLGPDSLPAAALRLGLGADYGIPPLTTITGSVPSAPDLVQRAENGFGQGQVLASPLGMALVAATVEKGAPVVPELIRGRPTEVLQPATTPDPAALDHLRPMMRAVVTEGTATKLAGLGEVYGKTGTAEYTDDGRAHGWFVGYRGDVAFAVLVVDGGTSAVAVDVAAKFLSAIG